MAPPSARGLGQAVIAVAVGGLAIASLAATAGPVAWPLALAEHFRLHYLVLAAAATAAAAAVRTWWLVDAGALVAIVNLLAVTEYDHQRQLPRGPPHRLVSINVLTENRDHAAVARFIASVHPEVLVLLEVDERWLADLATVTAGFPHRVEAPRRDNFGRAVRARQSRHDDRAPPRRAAHDRSHRHTRAASVAGDRHPPDAADRRGAGRDR